MVHFYSEFDKETRAVRGESKRLEIVVSDSLNKNVSNSEKLTKLVNGILSKEEFSTDETGLLSVLTLDEDESGAVLYNLNGCKGIISSSQNEAVIKEKRYITNIVQSKLPRIDSIKHGTSICALIKRFLTWIIELFCKLRGKMSNSGLERLDKYKNIFQHKDMIEGFSFFGRSLAAVNPELKSKSDLIERGADYSRQIALLDEDQIKFPQVKKLFTNIIKTSTDRAMNAVKTAEEGEELFGDVLIIKSKEKETKNKSIIISYSLIKTGETSFNAVVRVIESGDLTTVLDNKNKMKSTQQEHVYTKNFRTSMLDNGSVSDLSSLDIKDISRFSKALALFLSGVTSGYNKSLEVLDQDMQGVALLTQREGFDKTTSKKLVLNRLNKTFAQVVNSLSPDTSLTKIDNLKLFATYIHSYAENVKQYLNSKMLSQDEAEEHIETLKGLKAELRSMAASAYKIDLGSELDVSFGSEAIREIEDLVLDLEVKTYASSIPLETEQLQDVKSQVLELRSVKLIDADRENNTSRIVKAKYIQTEMLDEIAALRDIISQLNNIKKGCDIKEISVLLLNKLKDLDIKTHALLQEGDLKTLLEVIPNILELLPAPVVKRNPILSSAVWDLFGYNDTQTISAILKDLVSTYFESNLRKGASQVPQKALAGIINARAIQMHFINEAFLDVRKQARCNVYHTYLQNELKTHSLKTQKTQSQIGFYSQDMVDYLNKNVVCASGHDPSGELKKAQLLNFFQENSIEGEQEFPYGEKTQHNGVCFSGSYGCDSLKEIMMKLDRTQGLTKDEFLKNQGIKSTFSLFHNEKKAFFTIGGAFDENEKFSQQTLKTNKVRSRESNLIADAAALEVMFRAMLALPANVQISYKEENYPQVKGKSYNEQLTSNIKDIKKRLSKYHDRLVVTTKYIRNLSERCGDLEYCISCGDFDIVFKELEKTSKNQDEYSIPGKANIDPENEIPDELLTTALSVKNRCTAGDASVEPTAKEEFVLKEVVGDSVIINPNQTSEVQQVTALSGWFEKCDEEIPLGEEEQALLKMLKIAQPVISQPANKAQIASETVRMDPATVLNVLITCMHKPNLMVNESSRRLIENAFFQTGVISSALLSFPEFFRTNMFTLDSEVFCKFTNESNPDKLAAAVAMINMREVLYCTANNLLKYLTDYQSQASFSELQKEDLVIFGVKIDNITETISSLQKIVHNQDNVFVSGVNRIDWLTKITAFGDVFSEGVLDSDNLFNEALFYRCRGYLHNVIKQCCGDDLEKIKALGPERLGIILGTHLIFVGEKAADHGYPEIDFESYIWMQQTFVPVIEQLLLKESDAFKDEMLSACDAVMVQQRSNLKVISKWKSIPSERGLFVNSQDQALSIFKGFNVGGSRKKISKLPEYSELSSSKTFIKIFGDKDICKDLKIKAAQDGQYLEYTSPVTGFVFKFGWNKDRKDPIEVSLEIKSGDYKGEYDFADVNTIKAGYSSFVFEKGVWCNKVLSKPAFVAIDGEIDNFNHKNLLKIFTEQSFDEFNNETTVVERVTTDDEQLVLAGNDGILRNGILSESLHESMLFYKDSDKDKNIHKIILPRLDSVIEKNEEGKFIVQSGSCFSGVVSAEAIKLAVDNLFESAEKHVIPFENKDGNINFLFSADNSIFKGDTALPCLSGKIVEIFPGKYEVETTTCGFYSLAFMALEAKDYKAAIRFLNKAKKGVFDLAEKPAFEILINSWISRYKDHSSKKGIAVIAKALAIGQRIKTSVLSYDFYKITEEEIKYNQDSVLKILEEYSNKIFHEDNISVKNIASGKALQGEFHLPSYYLLAKDEIDELRSLITQSDVFLFDFIVSKLRDKGTPNKAKLNEVLDDLDSLKLYSEGLKSIEISFEMRDLINSALIDIINSKEDLTSESLRNRSKILFQANGIKLPTFVLENSIKAEIAKKEKITSTQARKENLEISSRLRKLFINSESNKIKLKQSLHLEEVEDVHVNFSDRTDKNIQDLEQLYLEASKNEDLCLNANAAFEKKLTEKINKIRKAKDRISLNNAKTTYLIKNFEVDTLKQTLISEIEECKLAASESLESFMNSDSVLIKEFSDLNSLRNSPVASQKDFIDCMLKKYRQGDFNLLFDKNDLVEDYISIFILKTIQYKTYEKALLVVESLDEAVKNNNKILLKEQTEKFAKLIEEGSSLNRYENKLELQNGFKDFLVSEYYLGIILREDQKQVIDSLVYGGNRLILCPPGFGKSKAITPCFCAIQAADGVLPVVITTSELVGISATDLATSNAIAFQQKRYEFKIDCRDDYSIQSLLMEYNRLLEAKQEGGFVVSSVEYLANLNNLIVECKAKEIKLTQQIEDCVLQDSEDKDISVEVRLLLKQRVNKLKEAELIKQSFKISEKLAVLIKIKNVLQAGKFLVDEADSVLDVNNWINKATGETSKIDPLVMSMTGWIFRNILDRRKASKFGNVDLFRSRILKNTVSLSTDDEFKFLLNEIASEIYEKLGTLSQSFQNIEKDFKKKISEAEFVDFITAENNAKLISVGEFEQDKEISAAINILRSLLTNILPNALKSETGKSFGYDVTTGCSVVPKKLGENLADTKFSNQLEMAVYLFLHYSIANKNICTFKSFQNFFQEIDSQMHSVQSEAVRAFFLELDSGNNSSTLNPINREVKAFELFSRPDMWAVRLEMAQSYVYHKTQRHTEQIRTNSQDMVLLGNVKACAISGTLDPYSMPKIFKLDKTVTNNSASEELELKLCNSYVNGIHSDLEEITSKDGFDELMKKLLNPDYCAVINAGGILEGETASSVVKRIRAELDNAYKIEKTSFNKDLLFVDTKTRKQMIWKAGEKFPTLFVGGVAKDNYLAYYSLSDTRGTDFKLPKGKGLFFPGKKMTEEDMHQSIMRLRDFGNSQSVEVILHQDIATTVRKNNGRKTGPAKLKEWLLKVQVDTVQSYLLSNLKQALADVQSQSRSLERTILEKHMHNGNLLGKEEFNYSNFLISKVLEAQLFDIVKQGFIVQNKDDFKVSLSEMGQKEAVLYVQGVYNKEVEKLELLLQKIKSLKSGDNVLLPLLEKQKFEKSKGIVFDDNKMSILKNLFKNVNAQLRQKMEEIVLSKININMSKFLLEDPELASKCYKLFYLEDSSVKIENLKGFNKLNKDELNNFHREVYAEVCKFIQNQPEFSFGQDLLPTRDVLDIIEHDIQQGLKKLRNSSVKFQSEFDFHKQYLQDTVLDVSSSDVLEQGALSTVTVVEKAQEQQQQRSQQVVLQRVTSRQNVQRRRKRAPRIRSKRHILGSVYSEALYMKTSLGDRVFRSNKDMRLNMSSGEKQIGSRVQFIYNQFDFASLMRLSTNSTFQNKHPTERYEFLTTNTTNDCNGLCKDMYVSSSVLASFSEKRKKVNKMMNGYVAVIYDSKNDKHFTQLCSENDAFALIPELKKQQKESRKLTEQEKEKIRQSRNCRGPEFTLKSYEKELAKQDERIFLKPEVVSRTQDLEIELFALTAGVKEAIPVFTNINKPSVAMVSHSYNDKFRLDLALYKIFLGESSLMEQEEEVLYNYFKTCSIDVVKSYKSFILQHSDYLKNQSPGGKFKQYLKVL